MIPYVVGNLPPNSSRLTRGLVKYVPGRGYFRAVPSQNGDNFVTSPPPPNVERFKPTITYTSTHNCSTRHIPPIGGLTRLVICVRKDFSNKCLPVLFSLS